MGHIVLLLFSFFTEAVILWQYASSLFTSSYSSKIRLALLSALYTILFLLSLLEQTGLNVVSFFVFNTVFLYMLFKLKLLLALFHSAILTAIMGISEIAVLGITSRFFPHFLLETDNHELRIYRQTMGYILAKTFLSNSPTPEDLAEINELLHNDKITEFQRKIMGNHTIEEVHKFATKEDFTYRPAEFIKR